MKLLICIFGFVLFGYKQLAYPSFKKHEQFNLLGKWISTNDSNYRIIITKSKIIEEYIGEATVDTFDYRISKKSCFQDGWNDKYDTFLRKYNYKKGDDFCYKLINCSSRSFTLVFSGNGAISTFKRLSK